MALDKNGVPIPVYTPPPPPPPDANPPDHINPQIENDVALLKGELERVNGRVEVMQGLGAHVAETRSRIKALEMASVSVTQTLSRFTAVEEAFAGMPKLLERIAALEGLNMKNEATISMMQTQFDSLEKRLQELWERGLVDPVSSA